MIQLNNVSKYHFEGQLGHELVLRDATISLPTDLPIALLGEDDKALTTILLMLAGSQKPDKGDIAASGFRPSPLIHAGGQPGASLVLQFTAAENIRMMAQIYGVDDFQLMALVEAACRFGRLLQVPVSKFDWPMRRALEIALISALPFDCYFVDRLHGMNGPQTWRLYHAARKRGAGLIFSTQRHAQASRVARMGLNVRNGSIQIIKSL